MKELFGHTATTSFSLWFENHLINYGEAHSNQSAKLYYIEDNRLPDGYFRYSSPHKQWVTEAGIGAGTVVPQYISGDGTKIFRGEQALGYFIDFQNGGVVVTGDSATDSLNLSGSYSVKDFNIYNTNETEESLVVETKFSNNSRFTVPESGISPYNMVTPAIFLNNEYIENAPFAFGGEDLTTLHFKAVVFAENMYQLDGVLSLFADTHKASFPKISFGDHPINEYGDLKNGNYLYKNVPIDVSEPLFSVNRVVTSKISENVRQTISPSLFVGFLDFEIIQPRYPRLY